MSEDELTKCCCCKCHFLYSRMTNYFINNKHFLICHNCVYECDIYWCESCNKWYMVNKPFINIECTNIDHKHYPAIGVTGNTFPPFVGY